MSLSPAPIDPIPEQTIRVAQAAFPKGNPYMTFRDEMGLIFDDDDFVHLYSHEGQPGDQRTKDQQLPSGHALGSVKTIISLSMFCTWRN